MNPYSRLLPVHDVFPAPYIHNSGQTYLRAFNHSMQPAIITDYLSGNILCANAAACNLFDYSEEEMLSKNSRTVFLVEDVNFKKMTTEHSLGGQAAAFL